MTDVGRAAFMHVIIDYDLPVHRNASGSELDS